MSVTLDFSSLASPGPWPKLVASVVIADAFNGQVALGRICSNFQAESSRPAEQLASGEMTALGASNVRKRVADVALRNLGSEVLPKTLAAEKLANEARIAFGKTCATAFAAIGAADLASAQATVRLVMEDSPQSMNIRTEFTTAVRDKVRTALIAAAMLPSIGSWAGLRQVAYESLGAGLLIDQGKTYDDVRRAEIAARIVRIQHDSAASFLKACGTTGEIPLPDSRSLIAQGHDVELAGFISEGEKLGIILPRSAIIGEKGIPPASTGKPTSAELIQRGYSRGGAA